MCGCAVQTCVVLVVAEAKPCLLVVVVVVVVVGWKGCGCKRRQPKKKAGGGLGGRAQRLPPRCIGCPCISWPREEATLMFLCSVFMLFLEGVSLQEEPGCIGSGFTRCLSVLVCLFLVSMLFLEGVRL